MQVIVDNLLVNYQRQGSGKKIILLHGWANSLNDLIELHANLSKTFDAISLDLPGFGGSQAPSTAWDLANYSHFLASFISKLELKDVYSLIGHSNGGAIAIKSLATSDVEAEKLVLIATAGIRGTEKGRLGAIKAVTKTGKLITRPLPSSVRKKLRGKLYSSIGSDLLVAEHLSDSFKKIVAEDLRSEASKLNTTTLLIYGEKDASTPVTYGQLYHELIDGSTLEIVAGAGHNIQKEKPSVVLKLIRNFLC